MLSGFQNAARVPELKRRLLFTLAMLAVYRLGVHVPTPGIDRHAMAAFFEQQKGNLLGFLNLFSGGALEQFSVFSLGIMPYISASIILQLLTVVFPYLERLSKEGEVGRRKITQYTRYGTVVLSIIQGIMISVGLEGTRGPGGFGLVLNPGWSFRLMTVITLTSGTAFIMWLGEQITERGIGNGISLIIFAGIVARLPSAAGTMLQFVREGEIGVLVALLITVLTVVVVGVIIFVERGQRRIPVQYAKRVVGRKMYGGQSSHLPLKINTANVIPPIFASSILIFPATLAQFSSFTWVQAVSSSLAPGQWLHDIVYVALIIFFAFFYTAVVFNPVDVAENMKKFGGYIPGIRPGQKTAEFIERVLSRITLSGAIYLSIVSLLPTLLIGQFNVPFFFGGTALLIVVGVALDTVAQMETHLISRNYEGFMKRGRLRGRRG
ncbi:MAG: preprotein translocase subunit SecY [Deltaproteobacteria bacterium]|nr:preprotein translocase subunit SecY [Deltaproteobacteria bacterium]MBI2228535.1 preprotein translocase subunit SecY [Deltaproteobacteria bacterium]MBI2367607.1 preprotein translocase subunit SecY [Deltaproteobacteria bacterium]MBI2532195.1 preprotein translocase subunit SecY [Deltaproteobacteria bacterium]MBI3066098.1 preprotein translocase subunit SecY [Deltaproteobacteria bacterium]